jgi:uncharacterized protein (TIGR03435 family)
MLLILFGKIVVTGKMRTAISAMSAICVVGGWLAFAQPAKERPSFEVASVKAMLVDDPRSDFVPRRSGDRVTMHNASLWTMIAWAYHLTNADYQLVAGPGEKLLIDDYDIQAIAPGSPGDDELRMMFQTLLEDRFQLKVHRETRELTAYDLVVAKGGPRLVAAPARDFKPGIGYGSSSSWAAFRADGKHFVGKSASVEEMVVVLTAQMRAPVRDRTGLTGTYDFDVAFSTGVDGSDKPVLTTAIHDLGLSLEKSKGVFEVLVIDHVEKPAAN